MATEGAASVRLHQGSCSIESDSYVYCCRGKRTLTCPRLSADWLLFYAHALMPTATADCSPTAFQPRHYTFAALMFAHINCNAVTAEPSQGWRPYVKSRVNNCSRCIALTVRGNAHLQVLLQAEVPSCLQGLSRTLVQCKSKRETGAQDTACQHQQLELEA
jgi:hypothetical protein